MDKFKPVINQFIRYSLVGCFNVVLDFSLLYVLVEFVHLWYMLAATLSFIIILTVSFLLNKFWAFQDSGRKHILKKQFTAFAFVNVVGMGINLAVLYILVEFFGLWYLWAKVFAAAVAIIWNFWGFRAWVFKEINQKTAY